MHTGPASHAPHVRAPHPLRRNPPFLVTAIAAACLAACSGGRAAPAIEPQAAVSFAPQASARGARPSSTHAAGADKSASAAEQHGKMMPGRVYAPTQGEVACPSLEFEEFLRAFFNSGDLQVRFTARPVVYKVPYYDYHNTEPGDPANPQWERYESEQPMHDRYRYDQQLNAYVSDSSRLRPGQRWTGVDADGKHVSRPVTELSVRQASDEQWQVMTPGRITTFTRRPDCWYATEDWTLDPFDGCRWPDECRAWREYEGHPQEGG